MPVGSAQRGDKTSPDGGTETSDGVRPREDEPFKEAQRLTMIYGDSGL